MVLLWELHNSHTDILRSYLKLFGKINYTTIIATQSLLSTQTGITMVIADYCFDIFYVLLITVLPFNLKVQKNVESPPEYW